MDYTKKLLEVRDLHKAYSKEGVPTKALNGITFDVLSGEYLGIMGASGSGKTTLLNCIATVIKPTSGQILLSGANISAFDGAKLAEYRGNRIGYLFQDFALLDNLTGRENILLPLSIRPLGWTYLRWFSIRSYQPCNGTFSRTRCYCTSIKFFIKRSFLYDIGIFNHPMCGVVYTMRKIV